MGNGQLRRLHWQQRNEEFLMVSRKPLQFEPAQNHLLTDAGRTFCTKSSLMNTKAGRTRLTLSALTFSSLNFDDARKLFWVSEESQGTRILTSLQWLKQNDTKDGAGSWLVQACVALSLFPTGLLETVTFLSSPTLSNPFSRGLISHLLRRARV